MDVGSKTFDGVRFSAYADDHLPAHIHGKYAETEVLVEFGDGEVRLSGRAEPIRPPNAKRSDVNKILKAAEKHGEELVKLWEMIHGAL